MKTALRHLWRTFVALLEYCCIHITYLLVLWTVFRVNWRALIDDAAVAFALPSVLTLAICALPLWMLRRRYSLATHLPVPPPTVAVICRWYTVLALLAPWITFAWAVDAWTYDVFMDPTYWRSLTASLSATAIGATFEEFSFRLILMGLLLRAGAPIALVLAVQTAVFVLAHHNAPFTGPHALFWYTVASVTYGAVYLASRSLMAPIVLHTSINLLLAQAWPHRYWIAPRPVEGFHLDWTRFCAEVFAVLGIGLLVALAFERWRLSCGQPPIPAARASGP